MKKESTIIVKALLDRTAAKEALLTYFSKDEEQSLRLLPEYPFFNLHSLLKEQSSLTAIHYSWFQEPLLKMAENERSLFLALFEKQDREKLKKLIGYSEEITEAIIPPLRSLLALELKRNLQKEEILPIECLPKDDALALLELDKELLLQLIDLLGIYDLAADLPQIVDKSILSMIASSLTDGQRSFLQYASKQSLGYLPERLNLKELSKDKAMLRKVLHKRGLERLGGALCMEQKDFLWHFLHKVDIGRAMIINKIIANPPKAKLVTLFKRQVTTLAKRIKK